MRELGGDRSGAPPVHGPDDAASRRYRACRAGSRRRHRAARARAEIGRRDDVMAACTGALDLGLRPGMAATHARALVSDLDVRPAEPDADGAAGPTSAAGGPALDADRGGTPATACGSILAGSTTSSAVKRGSAGGCAPSAAVRASLHASPSPTRRRRARAGALRQGQPHPVDPRGTGRR